MPRLRQPPTTAKKEELFDSEAVAKPVEEQPPEPKIVKAAEGGWEPEGAEPQRLEQPVVEKPVVAEPEPKQDDAAIALKKQLDTLRGSEEALKKAVQEREEAIRQHQEKLLKAHRQTLEQEEVAIDSTLGGYKAEAEKAQLDIENAISLGDAKAQSEAYRRLAQAEARISQLETGKEALKERKKELKKERRKIEEATSQPQQQQQLQQLQQQPHIIAWRQAHPEYFSGNRAKSAQLTWAFEQSAEEGLEPYSVPQLQRIDELLGFKQSRQEHQPEHRTNIVSAPVSREVPSSGSGQRQGGRITLTKDELEAAHVSGVTPQEYARQKQRLMEAKANGQYTGGQ